jgi:hypothetical protein
MSKNLRPTSANLSRQIADWGEAQRAGAADPRDPRQLDRELRQEYAVAHRAVGLVMSLRPPVAEIVANMRREVDAARERFVEKWGSALVTAFAGHFEFKSDGTWELKRPEALRIAPGLTFEQLCGLVPDQVKKNCEAIITAVVKPEETGTPFAARAAERNALEADKRAIAERHTAVVDAARAIGIQLDYLPDVQAEKDSEAVRLQRDRANREFRAGKESAVNAQLEPRAVLSDYIEGNRAARASLREGH